MTIQSITNPAANGTFKVMKMDYEIASRDQPFWFTLLLQPRRLPGLGRMTDYAPPSRNPADNDTLTGLLKLVLTKPCKHRRHAPGPGHRLRPNDEPRPGPTADRGRDHGQPGRPTGAVVRAGLPVRRRRVRPQFPRDDRGYGWIKANDRDISLFKQTTAASSPNTARLHDFADAMFFPDTLLNGVTIATEDAANAVLQNFAGTVKSPVERPDQNPPARCWHRWHADANASSTCKARRAFLPRG
ncbi:Phage-related protein [Fimbriiglobus ruber]|uniref:Phage-related protein n=1 Tax=Fimbriiglobus ruber TaxID=1908690 RepID=A0A225DSJ7_9BACT|nr:hypothetical protein [Fimbriiglobus ruber]OWK44053.1 Phage-related protein [Fimbriiglobus ruber]